MKRLTLLRHAKSSWKDNGLSDIERPLAKRGLRDAPMMGQRLAKQGLNPKLLLTSPAVRARQTAELIRPCFNSPSLEIRFEPDIYLARPGELLRILTTVSDGVDELILIGHNPGFTQLANMLLPDLALANLPTAGAVSMDCATESWRRIDAAEFTLGFYDYPKKP